MRSAPSIDKDSVKEPAVSEFAIFCFLDKRISPVSRPSFICIIEIPVSLSPERIARSMGAAPLQRGRSDA